MDNFSNNISEELILYKYNKVNYIQLKYNSGFSKANNIGMKKSKGKYILFLI